MGHSDSDEGRSAADIVLCKVVEGPSIASCDMSEGPLVALLDFEELLCVSPMERSIGLKSFEGTESGDERESKDFVD